VELSLGEVVDKVTILLLKEKHLSQPEALVNVRRELKTLREAWEKAGFEPMETLADWHGLCDVNSALWQVEDDLRDCEREKSFGPKFVQLARSVYHLNDRRACLKRSINTTLGSRLIEEKSYADYTS
tara:strand:+ start:169 stop:549 length:381 start_codon:yes stop_codon:yes gene_type:complete